MEEGEAALLGEAGEDDVRPLDPWPQQLRQQAELQVLQRENAFLRQTIQRYQAQLCIIDRKAQSLEALTTRKREEHVEERLQLQLQLQDLQEKLLAHVPHAHSRKRPEVASEVQVEVEKRKEMEGKYLKARDELHYYKQEWGRQVQELRQEQVLQISLLKKRHAQELQHKQAQCDALRAECEHLKKELHLVSQEQEHSKRRANVEKMRRPVTALAQFTSSSPLPSPIRPAFSTSAGSLTPQPPTSPVRKIAAVAHQRGPSRSAPYGRDMEPQEAEHDVGDEASEWERTPARNALTSDRRGSKTNQQAADLADEKEMTFSFIDDTEMVRRTSNSSKTAAAALGGGGDHSGPDAREMDGYQGEDMFALSRELSFAATPAASTRDSENHWEDGFNYNDTDPSCTVRRRILLEEEEI